MLLGGCGTPSLLITPVSGRQELDEVTVESGKGMFADKVVMIEVEGMLANVRTGGFLQAGENPLSLFAQQLERAEMDPSVKAVVLRVNSPGGTVTTSDTMYEMLLRFRNKTHKPVIAATQEVAASGAYYVCCACDKIVAHPTSLIGSIGVIFNAFDVSGTMSKIGVRSEAIKSGPMKDIASPFRQMNAEERTVLQNLVNEYYGRFVTVVRTNRKLKDSQTLALATDGRVFSGVKAVEMGLADQTGLLSDAIKLAKTMGHVPGAKVVMYKRPYGYSGSIYADLQVSPPQSNTGLNINFPGSRALLPTGFYYLWEP
jgi:protease IV